MDGIAEARIKNVGLALWTRLFGMKANVLDEQNVFDKVLAKNSNPGASRWWTGPYQPNTGYRAAVFIRAHSDSRGKTFAQFLHGQLGPALVQAGAVELRTHLFAPGSRFTWWTPNVAHDEPANRVTDGMLLLGAHSRAHLEQILNAEPVNALRADTQKHCLALYAYGIAQTYPMALGGRAVT